ncbi:MAG: tetratricopeptide repeat protein [Candidatus Obscuribacter sp.]|nr:tetratricopeptide repeat protein [Candidatus Obscuribacter sp.]
MTTSRQSVAQASNFSRTFSRTLLTSALALSLTLAGTGERAFAFDQATLIGLNNDGVRAINQQNYPLAIQKLEEAMKMDPTYKKARDNLSVAYNNYGGSFKNNPTEAIKLFHKAAMLDPTNPITLGNLASIIKVMGKDPNNFATRVALGDACRKAADFAGAIVEYREALKLKDDPKTHENLGDVYRVRDQTDDAILEYQAAARSGDSASIEVKLGQSFQTRRDIPNAIAAYGRAISMKSDDPEVQDALVTGWEAAVRDNPTAPENHVGLGQALQYRGDFGQAEAEFKLAISLSPGKNNPAANKLLAALPAAKAAAQVNKMIDLGVDQQSQKHYDIALQYYKKALTLVLPGDNKQQATIWMDIGTAYQAQEDFKNALDAYQKALQLDPSNLAAQDGIKTATAGQKDKNVTETAKAADALFKAGNYDGAIAKFMELAKSDPNDPGVHFNIGAALQLKKDYDGAIAEYGLAANLDPKNKSYQDAIVKAKDLKAQPIIEQAVAKHKAKDYIDAIGLYQKALDLVPNNADLVYNLASAQYAMQDYAGARKSYVRAIEIDPKGQSTNFYFIATIDENDGRGGQAILSYQKYLAAQPAGTYVAQAKGRIDTLSKNPGNTVKLKSEAELAKDADAAGNYAKAVDLQKAGQLDQAIALYQKAIDVRPDNPDYVFSLGTAYQAKGDADNAIASYQKASSLAPNEPAYKKAIADAKILKAGPLVKQAYDKQSAGDMPGAIDLYNQALQYDGNNASIYMNLGAAYQATDNFAKAFDAYQQSYNLDKKVSVDCLYLMGSIDENFGRGMAALNHYNAYSLQAPSGQYAAAAKERIRALSANPAATQKLATTGDIKNAQAASDAYNDGVKKQQASDFDGAIAAFQQASNLVPSESAYLYALGSAYQSKGDYDNAIKTLQLAVTKAPANQVAGYKQALLGAQQAQAQPLMEQAVQKHTAGDLAGAIPLYEKALALFDNNPPGWTNLAGAYQSNDDFANAKRCYLKAVALDPKGQSDSWYYAGLIDENYKRVPDAISEYGRYLAAKPSGGFAADARARSAAIKADPNKCQPLATKAQVQASGAAAEAYNAAAALQNDKKYDEAIAKYQEAIKAAPNEAGYYYAIGTAYQAKEDYDNAIAMYEKARNLNPREPAYPALIKQLRQAKASPLVNSAIEKQTQKNDIPGAIADYEAALRIDDDAATHGYLGTAYQAQNNTAKAMAEYVKALQMDKTLVDNYYYLGTVYEALKQPLKAIEEYQKFVRLAPAGNANMAAVKDRLKILAPGRK